MDCHTHCKHSHDTDVEPELMIKAAIDAGFKYIAFTDHSDKDYKYILPEYGKMKQLDVKRHIQEILSLQEKYYGRIYVALGMECSYHKQCEIGYSNDLQFTDKWDIILNSIHTVNGHDIYYPSYYGDRKKKDTYAEYLMAVFDSLDTSTPYDVVAHIGYCARKAVYGDNYMKYADFSDIIDAILRKIINKDVSLELNTHAKFTGANFLPHKEIVERYIELGGSQFTYGSDAHAPERVGEGYKQVAQFLVDNGVNYLNIYKRRKAQKVKI